MLPATIEIQTIAGEPRVTSLQVAEHFGKEHFHVLRDIRMLIETEGFEMADFTASNFGCSEYTDPTGRKLPMFSMTKNGFTLLVMGYTGPEAMALKVRYINEFDRMATVFSDPELTIKHLMASLSQIARNHSEFMPLKRRKLVAFLGKEIWRMGSRPADPGEIE